MSPYHCKIQGHLHQWIYFLMPRYNIARLVAKMEQQLTLFSLLKNDRIDKLSYIIIVLYYSLSSKMSTRELPS